MDRLFIHFILLRRAAGQRLLLLAILLVMIAPGLATPVKSTDRDCVEQYDPQVDYFPDKADLTHARGFTLEYFGHYKILTVVTPWPGAARSFRYVLVQCGTPPPDGFSDAQFIEVPIVKVIALTKPQLPHLELLDVLDGLLALDSLDRVYSQTVNQKIDEDKLVAVGWGTTIDAERILALEPDLVMATAYDQPQHNVHPILQRVGIPVVINAEYTEPTPLGRTEWLKFTAALFNKEQRAERLFNDIATRYHAYAELTHDLPAEQRPTVLTGALYGSAWFVPSGNSYLAQLLHIAGGDYLWADTDTVGNIPLDFEAVYARAWQADYWLTTKNEWLTRADMQAADARYEVFTAYQQGRVYNNNARLSATGGNDYWERATLEPDMILADLIKIFHPDLVPKHTLKYFRKLP
ncbi:MAG: ABC transporter substrate-binding protein [Candidatus Competibacteraceae bacterium]|jgi:iron complex transport system substrate-binding protein|nr:ABC transporter substrate-binding protein [Candidatus Competibacteraceae bacterium]